MQRSNARRAVADRRSARRDGLRRAGQLLLRATSTAASSSCASRTPIRRAAPPRASARSCRRCAGAASTGTKAPTSAARTARTARASVLAIYREYAERLLAAGHAFKCFCTPQRLEEMRVAQRAAGEPSRYDGLCRYAIRPKRSRGAKRPASPTSCGMRRSRSRRLRRRRSAPRADRVRV